MARTAKIVRKTDETSIKVKVNLDGKGECKIKSKVEFLNHMLRIFALHSGIDTEIEAEGDLVHHIVEDAAVCLGKAISNALGKREKLKRFGYAIVPMDDSLVIVAVDLKERPYCVIKMNLRDRIEDVTSEDMLHFFNSLASNLHAAIHIHELYGTNSHHKIEAAIKALALSIREAISERK